jgi:hypothetical protein
MTLLGWGKRRKRLGTKLGSPGVSKKEMLNSCVLDLSSFARLFCTPSPYDNFQPPRFSPSFLAFIPFDLEAASEESVS